MHDISTRPDDISVRANDISRDLHDFSSLLHDKISATTALLHCHLVGCAGAVGGLYAHDVDTFGQLDSIVESLHCSGVY